MWGMRKKKKDADRVIYWDIKCEWLSLSKQTKTYLFSLVSLYVPVKKLDGEGREHDFHICSES